MRDLKEKKNNFFFISFSWNSMKALLNFTLKFCKQSIFIDDETAKKAIDLVGEIKVTEGDDMDDFKFVE